MLKRPLGRGTNSEVWLAQEVLATRQIALKFFPRDLLADDVLLERLKQETQRHLALLHPHLAATYELVCDPGDLALAVEYVDGWSLASSKVDKLLGCYRVEEIENWIWQACAALQFAHELGIVHANLKPANFLVNAQDELKLTDFAIAAVIRQESSRRGLTKGLYAGLGFLSPQQAAGEEPTKLDDIYSLGATIFDLLTSTPPFYKDEIFAQIVSAEPPTMTARIAELEIQDDPVSPVWEDTVARCLAKNPADRPQSLAEVLELLHRASVPKPAEVAPIEPAAAVISPPEENPPAAVPSETPAPVPEIPVTPAEEPTLIVPPLVTPPVRSQMPLIVVGFAVLILAITAAAIFAVISLKHHAPVVAVHPTGDTNSVVATEPEIPGLVDTHFNPGGVGANQVITALAIQPDGKILAAGAFRAYNMILHKSIVRLNSDGTLDDSFQFQAFTTVRAVAPAQDGKIYIAGGPMLKGHPHSHILRLDADGQVDPSFNLGLKSDLSIRTLAVQADGKVLAGGDVSFESRSARLLRFNPDGTPDKDFRVTVSMPEIIVKLMVQPDGKILVAGAFAHPGYIPAERILRLNPDGTLDAHFNVGTGVDGNVLSLALQNDGDILISGTFDHVNGQPCSHLARLNPDGTVDTTFVVGPAGNRDITSLLMQSDGRIIITWDFSKYQKSAQPRIARLNADGSLDKSFDSGSGSSGSILSAALQPDGKILLGGSFTVFDGFNCGEIVRLNNPATPH